MPWVEVVYLSQPEGVQILGVLEGVAAKIEEVPVGGAGDQVCVTAVGDGWVVPVG